MKQITEIDLFTPVKIKWIDSYHANVGWIDLDDFNFKEHSLISKEMVSIGYVVRLDKDNVFLSNTMSGDKESMYDVFSIPIGCVLDIKRLK